MRLKKPACLLNKGQVLITMFRRWFWRLRGLLLFSSATMKIVALCVCIHLILIAAGRVAIGYTGISYKSVLLNCFSLNWPLLSRGFLWQLVTYNFLHGSLMHLLLNMWACVVFGSALERGYGARFFLKVFLTGGVAGGLGWLGYIVLLPHLSFLAPLTAWIPEALAHTLQAGEGLKGSPAGSICIGASAGVFALLGCFFALYPQRTIYVLLFFVLPLKLKSITLLWLLLFLTIAEMIFIQSPIAGSAHLCGGVLGYVLGWRTARSGLTLDSLPVT